MCGIGGILFSKDETSVLQRKTQAISDGQKHRGPDGQAVTVFGQHALCHQRLALVDMDGGAQPFTDNSERYYITYNGELYNQDELRKQLAPHYTFCTRCDTEVVLAAYIVWGEECLQKFDGMFAFLIWDKLEEQAFAARDPLGVKPFVYSILQTTFYFASEIKALLKAFDHKPIINPGPLSEFIIAPSLSGAGENSIFATIRYLQPGMTLRYSRKGMYQQTYYKFQWKQSENDEATLIAKISAALQHSVASSMKADFPVGVFLSGGLDSSLLTTLAAKHSSQPLDAFTIAFDNHEGITFDPNTIVNSDDLPFAKEIAKQTGARFHEVSGTPKSLVESMQELSRINDRVPAWEQEFSQHFLSRAASKHLKAVLVGDAADETNYGYYFLLNEDVNSSPLGLVELFGGSKRMSMFSPELQMYMDPMGQLEDEYRELVKQSGVEFGRSREENIKAMSVLVNQRWLGRLLHNGDIHTMHYGLEARVPFANPSLLEAIAEVSPELGFKSGVEKYALRAASIKLMSPLFVKRKKSALPRDPRLGTAYQEILHTLLQPNNEFIDSFLNREELENLSQQCDISENDRMLLFNMICLIQWGQHYAS